MTDLLARLQAALGDRYQIGRELGGGGMSRVFVADERGLGRQVVVKVLPPELGAALSAERFRQEIRLAASLQHPHVVPVLTAGEGGGLLYYTMPLIEGETLRERLARVGPLPVSDAIRILREVLDALAYAHRHHIVHRDIKPENVLLTDRHALVTDFGVAKALTHAASGGSGVTSAGVALGTPAYMAPEQVAADPQIDHRSDIYAAGILAYEMLAGRPPFGGAGESPQRVLAAQVITRPEPLGLVRPDLPPALAAAVMRCLEKDPADRWQSADDLRRALESIGATGRAAWLARSGRWLEWRTALLVLAVAGVAIAGWALVRLRARGAGPGSPTLVAVLPFSVRGGPDVGYLGEGMVNLLSTSLDGAGDLRAVDPHAVLSAAQRRAGGRGALDPRGAATVAARLGAGLYVLGDVVEAGGRVRIGASVYDRERGGEGGALASGTVEGSGSQLFALVDGLATQLLAEGIKGPSSRVTRVASVTTASLAAYKAYLDGEAVFRAGRADSAVTAFQRAIALDTAFALAYYRLSVAAEWATQAALAAQAAEQAVQHSSRLADHDRSLLRALLATRRGAGLEAEGLYRTILGTYPDDIEAWIQLGEVLFHYGPLQGRSIAESRAAFERVLYFDPVYVSAMVHLARIAAFEGRPRAVDSLVGLIHTLSPASDRDLEMRVLRAYAVGDAAAQQRVQGELTRARDDNLTLTVWDLAAFLGDWDGAEALARLLTDPARSGEVRANGHLTLAYLALARGRLGAARVEVGRAAAADAVRALEYGTLLELAPFVAPRRSALETARRALERLDAGAVPASAEPTVYFSAHDGIHGVLRDYLLGVVSARLGDAAAAERYAAELARETGPRAAVGLPRDFGLAIQAEVAVANRSPVQALAYLKQAGNEAWYEYYFASPFMAHSRERYVRAGLEAVQGDARRAIELFSGFEGYSPYDLMYAGPSHLRRAILYERVGDARAAASHYARFLELWKDCDPEFRPLLEQARGGLARAAGGAAK